MCVCDYEYDFDYLWIYAMWFDDILCLQFCVHVFSLSTHIRSAAETEIIIKHTNTYHSGVCLRCQLFLSKVPRIALTFSHLFIICFIDINAIARIRFFLSLSLSLCITYQRVNVKRTFKCTISIANTINHALFRWIGK